jgi:hypothetical protein
VGVSQQGDAEEALVELAQYLTIEDLMFLADSVRPIEPVEDEHQIRQRDLANMIDNVATKYLAAELSARKALDEHMDRWLQRIGKMDAHAAALCSIKLATDFIDTIDPDGRFEEYLAEVLSAEEQAAEKFAEEAE